MKKEDSELFIKVLDKDGKGIIKYESLQPIYCIHELENSGTYLDMCERERKRNKEFVYRKLHKLGKLYPKHN